MIIGWLVYCVDYYYYYYYYYYYLGLNVSLEGFL